jgi:cellulose synthase operon protein YhjU
MKAAAFDTKGVPPYLQSFDGSPIHDDYAVLSRWWAKRLQAPAGSVALNYNSVSLHDGNRYADGRPGNSMEIYRPRLTRLLGDLDRFFSELQASGRRAVVVFVPEHGAALRGDKIQIVGMREIPSPRISTVPVGIKLIGLEENPARKLLTVSRPTSYLAVSQLLSGFIRTTPFGKNSASLEQYVRELPATEFVAENNDLVVVRRGKQYFIRSKGAAWIEYDPSE